MEFTFLTYIPLLRYTYRLPCVLSEEQERKSVDYDVVWQVVMGHLFTRQCHKQ